MVIARSFLVTREGSYLFVKRGSGLYVQWLKTVELLVPTLIKDIPFVIGYYF